MKNLNDSQLITNTDNKFSLNRLTRYPLRGLGDSNSRTYCHRVSDVGRKLSVPSNTGKS